MMFEHLSLWYQVIVASEPLLEDAIRHLGNDGFEGELKAFYKKHLQDEKHHAKWLREDLGDRVIQFNMKAAELAGLQYYLVRHLHPVCLMGYMIILEGKPIEKSFIDQVELELGEKASRTVRIHAENDPEHIKELLNFHIPDEFKPMVEVSKLQTLKILESF